MESRLIDIYYLLLLGFGLLGLVLVAIRSERERLRREYKETLKTLKVVSIARGNRR